MGGGIKTDSKVLLLLGKTARRIVRMRLLTDLFLLSTILPFLAWIFLLLEHFSDHETASRSALATGAKGLLICWLLVLLGAVAWRLILGKGRPDAEETARRIGWGSDKVRDRLLNGLQVLKRAENGDTSSDPELVAASLDHVLPELDHLDFSRVLPRKGFRTSWKRALISWSLALLLVLLGGKSAGLSAKRLLWPDTDFRGARAFSLELDFQFEDSLRIGRLVDEQSADILVRVKGSSTPAEIRLLAQDLKGDTLAWRLPVELGQARLREISPGRELLFQAEATEHRLGRSRLIQSPLQRLSWSSSPILDSLHVVIQAPGYTRMPRKILQPGSSEWSCPAGSRVTFSLLGDRALQSATLKAVVPKGELLALPFDLAADSMHASLQIRARRHLSYHIEIRDLDSLANRDPMLVHMDVIPDRAPRLRVLSPIELEGDIARSLQIPVAALATDDYGFSACRIAMRRVSALFGEEDIPDPASVPSLESSWMWRDMELQTENGERVDLGRLARIEGLIDAAPLDLMPDDEVQFFLELWDNNGWQGASRVTSSLYRFKLPGLEELFAETEENQDEIADDAKRLLDRSQKNHQKLKDLKDELRREPEMTWEREQKLKQVVQEQQEIAQEAGEISKKLEKMEQKLEQNRLVSPELQEKLKQLRELMQQVMNPELMEKLRKASEQAMKQPQKEQTQRPSADMEEVLKTMEEQLDRFLAVLEEMRLEQKLEELARRSEQLLEEQRQLHKEMEQNPDPASLSKQQDKQKADASDLRKEMDELQSEFGERSTFPQEQMDQAMQQMDQQQIAEQMEQSSQELQSGQQPSDENKEKLDQDLNELASMLQKSLQQMQQAQNEELARELAALAEELLMLSLSQESVGRRLPGLAMKSPLLPDLAVQTLENRMGVQAGAREAYRLSRKSFHVPKGLLQQLGNADLKLEEMLAGFHERKLGRLRSQSPEAMARINRAILMLKEASRDLNSGASASGFQEMMEKLAQSAGEQQCLNGQCNKLLSMKPGQSQKPMSISFGEAQQQQSGIRKDMEAISEKLGEEGKKALGDLGKMAGDMKEVEKDLENLNYTERTQKLQERILSRLLDAQRSLRRQDESKKRKSRSAQQLRGLEADEQPDSEQEIHDLRRDLLRALQGDYSPESQELIRLYFRTLEELDAKVVD